MSTGSGTTRTKGSARLAAEPPAGHGVTARLADALRGIHPIVATFAVATIAFAMTACVALLLGSVIEHYVVGGTIGGWDHDVAQWFADHRTPTWNSLSVVGSYLAETVTIVALIVVVAAILALRRHWWLAVFVITSLCLEALVYLTATFVIVRDRPAVPRLEHLIVSDSFPSGHTAAAVAMYGTLAVTVWTLSRSAWVRALFLAVAIVFPVLVATARVYRGMHNPTDVACGALLGACCLAGGWLAAGAGAELAARRKAGVEAGETAPSLQPVAATETARAVGVVS
jgi:undecaprenyl-diphosphatase